jgi:hypothetical protein
MDRGRKHGVHPWVETRGWIGQLEFRHSLSPDVYIFMCLFSFSVGDASNLTPSFYSVCFGTAGIARPEPFGEIPTSSHSASQCLGCG